MATERKDSLTSTRRLHASDRENIKILVVDDEMSMRKFLVDLLSQKYTVEEAENCNNALKKVNADFFNVALVDVNLPDMSGKQFLKLCMNNFLETQIIIMTGAPEYEDAVSLIKSGAFDYVTKPFDIERLLKKVETAIDEGKRKANEKLPGSNYKIVRRIGSGNAGIVLLVERDGVEYAMKILKKDDDPFFRSQQLKRFKREAKILSGISHPGVVRIFDYDLEKENELPFIVMEYVKGEALSACIAASSLNFEQKIDIVRQTAETLHQVHQSGVLHRDIKPENILVTDDFLVKISDFGISRVTGSSMTMTKDIVGTPAYMSPESFESPKNVDHRSDIFSLGILTYEIFTGIRPFDGSNLFHIIDSIKSRNPVKPSKINPEIPSWLEDMMAKMLAKKPDDRFTDALQIVKCINHYTVEPTSSSMTITAKILRSMLFIKRDWS